MLALLLVSGAAFGQGAQAPDWVVGKWKARYNEREARLTIEAAGGKYAKVGYFANASHDACSRLRGDLAIAAASSEEVSLTLLEAKVMNGCADTAIVLKRSADGARLEGTLNGTPVVFVKD